MIYRLEVRKIQQEIVFILDHETNKELTSDLFIKELSQLTERLNDLIQLQKNSRQEHIVKERELKKAITNISHDIRTPLTSLTGYFQLLNESDSEEERDRYTTIINNRIENLKSLLENNFVYLKTQDDSYTMNTERVNLSQLLKNNLLSYYNDFISKQIEPKIEIPASPIFIQANEEVLNRIINNLIQNSLTHGNKFISVAVFEENTNVHLVIENGVHSNQTLDLDNIFDRFYKNDDARTAHSTGLGLTIVKELVKSMQGQIKAFTTKDSFKIKIIFPK